MSLLTVVWLNSENTTPRHPANLSASPLFHHSASLHLAASAYTSIEFHRNTPLPKKHNLSQQTFSLNKISQIPDTCSPIYTYYITKKEPHKFHFPCSHRKPLNSRITPRRTPEIITIYLARARPSRIQIAISRARINLIGSARLKGSDWNKKGEKQER